MTEDLIKQNAEEYASKFAPAKKHKTGIPLAINHTAMVSFIAGAHSRDEEVASLLSQLEDKDGYIAHLREELNKLRNPWISVEDRLPEKEDGKFDMSAEVLVRTEDYPKYIVAAYDHRYNRWWATYELEKVTHWQPIKFIQQ